ncbi:MAG TPA: NADH-quinone oxidoreductase subunit J [Gammaproteobacteria bacterium]|jgi:NADH-quinone oxidoreductase subunit J|nr:NADH-quinone oxidoreductase subunit J [Gammaproteobacteria bacterium]
MPVAFYISALIAIVATLLTVTRYNAIHALLYLVVSLLAVAVVFYTLGAPFAAALEVIIYAGAIMVLFVFVVMMLNLTDMADRERRWLNSGMWVGPGILSLVLFGEIIYMLLSGPVAAQPVHYVGPAAVGVALYTRYVLAVEIASMLLLAGLIGAYHFGRRHSGSRAGKT